MKNVKLSGAVLAMGAAALFSTVPAFAADTTGAPMVSCKGVNSCKSASNACKGQGVTQMTKDDCTKAGGTVADDAGASMNSSTTPTTDDGVQE